MAASDGQREPGTGVVRLYPQREVADDDAPGSGQSPVRVGVLFLASSLDQQAVRGFVSQRAPTLPVSLMAHPRQHQREVMTERFWGDTSGEQALKNLRTVLSNLPYLPGGGCPVSSGGSLRAGLRS